MNRVVASGVVAVLAWSCSDSTEPEGLVFEAVSQSSLTAIVGTVVTPAPAVRVTSDGEPAAGVPIEFRVTGGGQVANPSTSTDADGIATSGTWTLGTVAQPQSVTAYSGGVPRVVFSAVGTPTAEWRIALHSGNDQTGNSGSELPERLRARVTDVYDNPIGSVAITFSVASGNGSIAGGSGVTDNQGVATSGPWTLGAAGGVQQVRAQVQNLIAVFVATACDAVCQGFQFLFMRDGDFYRRNIGGTTTRITTAGIYYSPALSSDGRRIAFMLSGEFVGPDLYIMNADGSGLQLRSTAFHSPSWAPDGRRLAVVSGSCAFSCAVLWLGADDQFTPEFVADSAASPAWSPDGTRIAFVRLGADTAQQALHAVNIDGTQVRVVIPRNRHRIEQLAWSPDGNRIAYARCITGRCDIFTAAVDGSDIRQLTTVGSAHEPSWSLDGTKIAFSLWSTGAGEFRSSIAWVDAQTGGSPNAVISRASSPVWWPVTQPSSPAAGNR